MGKVMLQPNFYYDSQKTAVKSSVTHKIADITSNAALGLGVGTAVGVAGALVLGGVQAIVFSGIAFATLGAVVGDSWWKARMTPSNNETSSTNNIEVFEAISQFRAIHPEITSEMIIASLKKLENTTDLDSSQKHN